MLLKIYSKIHKTPKDPCKHVGNKVTNSLFLSPNTSIIVGIFSSLRNSSSSHDGISVKLTKKVKFQILKPLAHIINLSFSHGQIPDSLKIAKVVPIYKKSNYSLFSNYRPISILPAFSKIIEKLADTRMLNFLSKHNILNDHQFGFRQHISTDMAIHTLMNKFYESIEKDQFMLSICIDFSRAFDTISHNILMKKLYFYGFRGKVHAWIQNYLTNGRQFVDYNKSHSQLGNLTAGVPQGSILGPLLFIRYVNDIHNISKQISCIQYADDTTIYANGTNVSEVAYMVNTELECINE